MHRYHMSAVYVLLGRVITE